MIGLCRPASAISREMCAHVDEQKGKVRVEKKARGTRQTRIDAGFLGILFHHEGSKAQRNTQETKCKSILTMKFANPGAPG